MRLTSAGGSNRFRVNVTLNLSFLDASHIMPLQSWAGYVWAFRAGEYVPRAFRKGDQWMHSLLSTQKGFFKMM